MQNKLTTKNYDIGKSVYEISRDYVKIKNNLMTINYDINDDNRELMHKIFHRQFDSVVLPFEKLKQNELDYALLVASDECYFEIVKVLLDFGADVHVHDDICIKLASSGVNLGKTKSNSNYFRSSVNCLRELIKAGANVNNGPLQIASNHGDYEIIKILLESGADVNDEYGYSLRHASQKGHFEIVKLLLKYGADINVYYDCPLRIASEQGHFEIVKLLLESGANVHSLGEHAIRLACHRKHYEIVLLLKEYGASTLDVLKDPFFEKYYNELKMPHSNEKKGYYTSIEINDNLPMYEKDNTQYCYEKESVTLISSKKKGLKMIIFLILWSFTQFGFGYILGSRLVF